MRLAFGEVCRSTLCLRDLMTFFRAELEQTCCQALQWPQGLKSSNRRLMRMYFCTLGNTPVGPLRLVADERGLNTVWFLRGRKNESPHDDWKEDPAFFAEVERQLQEYFAGALREFEIPLCMNGTDFQKKVWKNLQKIPYGETISYGELARRIGDPKAVRAVGAANGQNPLPIIVPCHSVIGSNGSLTGFGGGLENKRKLLELESRQRSLYSR